MASASNRVINPDHIIIWCDKNMGVKENNTESKEVLNQHANLEQPLPPNDPDEIDRFICNIDPYFTKKKFEDLIKSPLRMFTDEEDCLQSIHDNMQAGKHIFLITSGERGATIIPQIHKILSGRIYIFCAQRTLHEEWTTPYEKDIEIYDDEKGVFARVLSDIGAYYLTKAGESNDSAETTQYCYWARRLYMSATRIDQHNRNDYLDYITSMLTDLNATPSDGYDSDVTMAYQPNE